jgi:hypothetical protein
LYCKQGMYLEAAYFRPGGVERLWPVLFHWDSVYWIGTRATYPALHFFTRDPRLVHSYDLSSSTHQVFIVGIKYSMNVRC